MAERAGQCGGAFAILVVALFLGIAGLLSGFTPPHAIALSRDRASDRALSLAREALLAHAAARPIDSRVGPGYLPCPDLDDDGWAESTCGSLDGQSGQARRLGRLPWKTLGLAQLRDGHGELLWYAVASKHKGLLNCEASAGCLDMSPNEAIGAITVRDPTGALVHDGRLVISGSSVRSGALAVVIAPGGALHGQSRPCPPLCDARDFLEALPGIEDNAAFHDRHDDAGRPGNGDGFIQGPVRGPDGTLLLNDRLAVLAYEDLMPRILARVAGEVASCLRATASQQGGRYPASWPACNSPGARETLAFSGCNIDPGLETSWWSAWRDHVAFAVSAAHAKPGGFVDFHPPAGRHFAVVVSARKWPACTGSVLAWNPSPGDAVSAFP